MDDKTQQDNEKLKENRFSLAFGSAICLAVTNDEADTFSGTSSKDGCLCR